MFLLWLLFLTNIEAYICPDGYNDGLDGNCYSGLFTGLYNRNDAYNICAGNNAYLYTVNNFFDNQRINAGNLPVYVGLTCLGNEITSCQWDTGKDIELGDFTNFYDGKPNASNGACVIMMTTKSGLWYSVDCSQALYASFECKYTPGIDIPNCLFDNIFGYAPNYFRGKCYFLSDAHAMADGTKLCRDAGGDMASIHSDGENSFVGDMTAQYMSNFTYMNLGLQWNGGNYIWSDGTPYDYQDFGHQNIQLGSCVILALVNADVPINTWINSPCSQRLPIVCKKDPFLTTQPYTLSPSICSETQFFTDFGTLYSPGYPDGSLPNHCEYFITEIEDYQIQINFEMVHLDFHSSISLYNSLFDKTPFAVLTNQTTGGYWQSSANMLKIVYDTSGSENFNNYWEAKYVATNPVTSSTALSSSSKVPAPIKVTLTCSFVIDWSYHGSSTNSITYAKYIQQRDFVSTVARQLFESPDLNFSANYGFYGDRDYLSYTMFPDSPFNQFDNNGFNSSIMAHTPNSTISVTDICDALDEIDTFVKPSGNTETCLVILSGENYGDFGNQNCDGLLGVSQENTISIGAALNGETGIRNMTLDTVVDITDNFDGTDVTTLVNAIMNVITILYPTSSTVN